MDTFPFIVPGASVFGAPICMEELFDELILQKNENPDPFNVPGIYPVFSLPLLKYILNELGRFTAIILFVTFPEMAVPKQP